MILALNIPLLLAAPYYYWYGFGDWWITAGLVLWLIAVSLSKVYKLPVYKALVTLQSIAVIEIAKERRKFNTGNIFQAILYSGSVVLIGFGLRERNK